MEPIETRIREALSGITIKLNGWGPAFGTLAQSIHEWALHPKRAKQYGWPVPCEAFNIFQATMLDEQMQRNRGRYY